MNRSWRRRLGAAAVAAALLMLESPAATIAENLPASSAAASTYMLTHAITAEVKSVLNEREAGGTRLGAVVRLTNQGTSVVRVPDYEVRLSTADGVKYTLNPSAANAKAIQPKERVELSYLVTVDRQDEFSISELSWISADDNEYPRKETTIATIPVVSVEWKGDGSGTALPVNSWGAPFALSVLSPSLEYTPVSTVRQSTPQGPATVVVLLVENKGELRETVPDFRVDGRTEQKVYPGKRVEQDPIVLEPGERRYIHYAIVSEQKISFQGFTVLTPESFVHTDLVKTVYSIGRLRIGRPELASASGGTAAPAAAYELGKPIGFDPLNKLVRSDVQVSLVELHLHEAEGAGYQTAIAKFRLDNLSDQPVPVPSFATELISSDGFSYSGARQKTAVETLAPKLSYLVSYSYNVPDSEKGDKLTLKILDSQTAAPYGIPIAAVPAKAVKGSSEEAAFSMYPFRVKVDDWTINAQYALGSGYSYKLRLNLDITREGNIVVDSNFSKMRVEIVDQLGRMLSSKVVPFTGANRLVSGWQNIDFDDSRSQQLEYPLSVYIYETMETPFGEAKRLVKKMKQ
ncbi:hypothetical protein RAC89_07835 [Paenibacillus sp. GD4]|uniref:hypothetical protein n=1 Tax=Paenibacillus sp. GD4 TaxID=3068890 RepID=UPI00279678D9|nr:hypothetical protein [Paenibacillus sp. GD4]MDQ1910406.1 hypothetical protein [Paenibacillus sp. GD4]